MGHIPCNAEPRAALRLLRRSSPTGSAWFGAQPLTVVASEVHARLFKSLAMLDFRRDRVRLVPADAQGSRARMRCLEWITHNRVRRTLGPPTATRLSAVRNLPT
jgi:hypothetical protein